LDSRYLVGSSEKDREIQDFYRTPAYATKELLKKEKFSGSIWECACGDGAISELLPKENLIISTDLYDRGYGQPSINFLETFKQVNNIITNPPYKQAEQFLIHSFDCADHKIAMLLKLNFLEGQKRHGLFKQYPPKTIYVFSKRLSFDKGNDQGRGSGLLAYTWMVWEKAYSGDPIVKWIL